MDGYSKLMTTPIISAHEVTHSVFSPSGSERWLSCPGSIKLVESLKIVQTSSVFAMEGTAAHELCTWCLRQSVDAIKFLDQEVLGFKITMEMVNAVQLYINFIMQHRTFESVMYIEQTVDLSFLQDSMKGTADCIIENPTELNVFDFKYGKGIPVEAHENTQMSLYAIGVLHKIYESRKTLDHIETINLHIVQPRCPHREGPVRTFVTSVKELRAFAQLARAKIVDACSNNPTFEPGEKQCKWCPAAPVCKPLAEFNLSLAKIEFAHLKTEKVKLDPATINVLSKQEIAHIIKHSKIFTNWLGSMVKFALAEMKIGHEFPDFKLVRKRANRIWKDSEIVLKYLTENLEIPEDKLFTKKFISPAQAEHLVGKKHKEDLVVYITKPIGDITLAPESDPRPAVNSNDGAVADFSQFLMEDGEEDISQNGDGEDE